MGHPHLKIFTMQSPTSSSSSTSAAHTQTFHIAVVGCGVLARATHIPNIVREPAFRLHTLCDIDDEALRLASGAAPEAAFTKDFQEVFSNPEIDMVVVATTERFRMPLYRAAIANCKPVYTEKPLADTLENCRVAAEEFTASGIPFCIGHNRRCSPAMVEARRIFQRHRSRPNECPWRFERPGFEKIDTQGEEDVPMISIRLNDDWRSWKHNLMEGDSSRVHVGGMLMEMTHFADLARWFLQSEAREVMAMCHGPLNYTASFWFEDGSLVTLAAGANGTFGYPKELLEIMANGGMLVVDHMLEIRTAGIPAAPAHQTFPLRNDRFPDVGTQGGLAGWLEKKAAACAEAERRGDPSLHMGACLTDKGHDWMLHEFVREIRGERDPVSPARDGYEAARICFAAIKSVHERRVVELSEIQ